MKDVYILQWYGYRPRVGEDIVMEICHRVEPIVADNTGDANAKGTAISNNLCERGWVLTSYRVEKLSPAIIALAGYARTPEER